LSESGGAPDLGQPVRPDLGTYCGAESFDAFSSSVPVVRAAARTTVQLLAMAVSSPSCCTPVAPSSVALFGERDVLLVPPSPLSQLPAVKPSRRCCDGRGDRRFGGGAARAALPHLLVTAG